MDKGEKSNITSAEKTPLSFADVVRKYISEEETQIICIYEPYLHKKKKDNKKKDNKKKETDDAVVLCRKSQFLKMCFKVAKNCVLFEITSQLPLSAKHRTELDKFWKLEKPHITVKYYEDIDLHDRRFNFININHKVTEVISGRGLGMIHVTASKGGNDWSLKADGFLKTNLDAVEYSFQENKIVPSAALSS
uniref:MIT_C domain-containing protein n=1 Tax=Steinernema glaseri TaxID=37863 RepID=A0A1I8ARS8_9BILA